MVTFHCLHNDQRISGKWILHKDQRFSNKCVNIENHMKNLLESETTLWCCILQYAFDDLVRSSQQNFHNLEMMWKKIQISLMERSDV